MKSLDKTAVFVLVVVSLSSAGCNPKPLGDTAKTLFEYAKAERWSDTHIERRKAQEELAETEDIVRRLEGRYRDLPKRYNPLTERYDVIDSDGVYHKLRAARELLRRQKAKLEELDEKFEQEIRELRERTDNMADEIGEHWRQ